MAATKVKKAPATTKVASTKSKKVSKTKEQIATLEKALEKVNEENVLDLVPEEVKAEIVENENNFKVENVKPIDFDAEVKKILDNPEPPEEVKEQVEDFEKGKGRFVENIEKTPEKAEELIEDEIKRAEALKKKVEKIRENIRKASSYLTRNDQFTNLWNGTDYGM